MSRSRHRVRCKYLPSGVKRVESQRFRAKERHIAASGHEEDLPIRVAHYRRWNLWSWD